MIVGLALLVAAQASAGDRALCTQVLDEINTVRRKHGLKPLVSHPQLEKSAVALALDLADRRVLEHRDRRGWDLVRRVEEAGYTDWTMLGENVAFGQRSAKQAVQDWMGSPPHRREILELAYRETGIAVARSRGGTPYWVQQFGAR